MYRAYASIVSRKNNQKQKNKMSESNKNVAQELTGSVDDAYSHGYSEELGGNWNGQPHKHRADGVDVWVGGEVLCFSAGR